MKGANGAKGPIEGGGPNRFGPREVGVEDTHTTHIIPMVESDGAKQLVEGRG